MTDVFAVERRHERAIERSKHFMRDLVASVFDVLEVTRLALDIDEVDQQVVQQPSAFETIFGTPIEQVEEAVVLRDQSEPGQHTDVP